MYLLILFLYLILSGSLFPTESQQDSMQPEETWADLGKYDLSMKDEFESERFNVKYIDLHPNWNFNHASYDADIAVISLTTPATFSNYIQPICLPDFTNDEIIEGMGVVSGWGKSQRSGANYYDNRPSKLELPIVKPSVCYTTFPRLAQPKLKTSHNLTLQFSKKLIFILNGIFSRLILTLILQLLFLKLL